MNGTVITAAIAISGPMQSASDWDLRCEAPMEILIRQLRVTPRLRWSVPGSPATFQGGRRSWVSVSLLPDLVEFEEAGIRPGKTYTFSHQTSTKGLKGEILKRLGLFEVRSRGFGATLRFASAPNWAFQFKGLKKLTIAYITRF
ncbi:MAG: hypothetical protein H7Y17_00775 [Chlorobia bacterium]|nr:hypothetical protein [Fimbriimonadaceae bacterium]